MEAVKYGNQPLERPTPQQIARIIRLLDQTGKGLTSGTIRIIQGDPKNCVPFDIRPIALRGMEGIETVAEFIMDSEERGWILEHAFMIDRSKKNTDPQLQIFRRSYEDSPYGGNKAEWAEACQIETSALGGLDFDELMERLEALQTEENPAVSQLVRPLVRKFWMKVQKAVA